VRVLGIKNSLAQPKHEKHSVVVNNLPSLSNNFLKLLEACKRPINLTRGNKSENKRKK
jgi:hypothetical protein